MYHNGHADQLFNTIVALGFKPILMMAWMSIHPYWMLVGIFAC
jgi:hypothetical protein